MPHGRNDFRKFVFALGLALAALAQAAEELAPYVDLKSGFRVSYPKAWKRSVPQEGPVKLVFGEPLAPAFILCSIEQAGAPGRISTQGVLDRDLVRGFRTSDWPQQLAGPRNLREYQVREIGGVPMGAIDWDGEQERDGKPTFARGVKVFRTTPRALWTAECVAIAASRDEAESHFALNVGLIGDIIGSVRFPR